MVKTLEGFDPVFLRPMHGVNPAQLVLFTPSNCVLHHVPGAADSFKCFVVMGDILYTIHYHR